MWTEPATGRPLQAPVSPGRGLAREAYRSKIGVPLSRAEVARAERLARLKALRAEVMRPSRAELRAMAAEVRSDETLARLRLARDKLDRVDGWLALWRRNAGRRAPLPEVLVVSRDESLNAFTEAWTAAQQLLSTVAAVTPGHTAAELRSLAAQVHRDAALRPGRLVAGRSPAGGRTVAVSPTLNPPPVPGRWPAWRAEYRRLAGLINEQDALTASALPGSAARQGHLAEAARLRAQAVKVRGG